MNDIMGHAARSAESDAARAVGEQRFVLHNVSWEQYEAVREIFDDVPGLRMTYLEGVLELMSPSFSHEWDKKTIARLVEAWASDRGLDLNGLGSMTFKRKAKERGLEPDECYVMGPPKETPDIAFEVVVTSGGIDKLAVYQGLDVPEVWFWQDSRFRVHRLGPRGYEVRERSEILPDLDFDLLAKFVGWESQTRAVKAFLEELHRGQTLGTP